MKIRKLLSLLLVALLMLGVFAGCSAKSTESYYDSVGATEGVAEDGLYGNNSGASTVVSDRKLIRRITLNAETEDMDSLLTAVDSKVAELGGYVESRDIRSGSDYASYKQSRYARLTIRIPAEKLDAFVSHVGNVSNVTDTGETSEDVTLSYVATESRMKALQAEEERLLALIDEAKDLTELLQLDGRLTEVRTELEQVTSQLKLYDNLVDYGTVSLEITEVQTLTPVEEPSFWERITDGFTQNMKNMGNILKELTIFMISMIPYLIPVAVILVAVVLIVKLTARKKKSRTPPFPTKDEPKE